MKRVTCPFCNRSVALIGKEGRLAAHGRHFEQSGYIDGELQWKRTGDCPGSHRTLEGARKMKEKRDAQA